MIARGLVPVLAAGGIAIGSVIVAAPASAGCQGAHVLGGYGSRCDDPIQPDGWFRRCDTGGFLWFGGGTNCYMVDTRNMGPNAPYIP